MKYIREYTDADLERVANLLSKKVVIRESGTVKETDTEEQQKMFQMVYGALLSSRWNHAEPAVVQGILDYAEFMFNNVFPEYEGYRSIYNPLDAVLDRTLTEIRVDEDKI